ncbi:MAG: lysophospholipid acyltransferase family protein [Acidobacteriota bacterium]|nr:lysophospholipid acyltransferase family protein [Acidobacteriota bacterium]
MPNLPQPTFRHRVEFRLFRVLDRLLSAFPKSTVQTLGQGMGFLAFHLDRRHRNVALENIRASNLGLTEAEAHEVARASFRHFGELLFSSIPMMHAEASELDKLVAVEGLEHFDTAVAEGKGFIQLTGHYGNWEAIALAQSRHGRGLAVIARELDNPLLEPELTRLRTRFGNTVIPKDGGVRGSLKALKAGQGVGFLLDQDALGMGIFVRFMGRWASTFLTAGTLAVKFDLPILPVFSWPEADGSITVRFEAPFHAPRTEDADRDAWTATQLMTRRIEDQVRKDPRWWFWMHQRFKTQPRDGHPVPPPEWIESYSASFPPQA